MVIMFEFQECEYYWCLWGLGAHVGQLYQMWQVFWGILFAFGSKASVKKDLCAHPCVEMIA